MPASDQFWRPLSRMHTVFALSAVALLLATLLMMQRDHDDEWREHQQVVDDLRSDKLRSEMDELTGGDYEQKLEELRTAAEQADQELQQQAQELDELRTRISGLQGEVDLRARQTKAFGAERDVARANYDLGVRDEVPADRLDALKAEFDRWQQTVDDSALELQHLEGELAAAKEELASRTAMRDGVLEGQKLLQADVERIEKALAQIDPEPGTLAGMKRWLMMQPIVDGFNSPHGIKQDWLPELKQTLGMANVARFDRCRTCHVTIDDFGPGDVPNFPHGTWDEGKYPHPYASHPHPELYLSANSPHPLPTFGCTICHDGDGSGTSFQTAEHTPNNPGQAHRWEEEHGWHANHFWEYPMQPNRLLESTCIKCHHSVIELGINPQFGATAPKVFEGFELVKTYGCFGCHEINGYDGNLTIGPDIRLEPSYGAAARQVLHDPVFQRIEAAAAGDVTGLVARTTQTVKELSTPLPANGGGDAAERLQRINDTTQALLASLPSLAEAVAANPTSETEDARRALMELVSSDAQLKALREQLLVRLPAGAAAATDTLHLDVRTHALTEALKDADHPGLMRKVGPSLRHIASKTTPEFVAYWTEDPARFRPDTRMPQFFHLTNQQDELAKRLQPVQLAGISAYLEAKSQPLDLMQPREGYTPDAARGRELFARRGCLACHGHDDEEFQGIEANFGPNLTKVHEKIKPGEDGFRWLYTWVRDPMRHHARTKMPNLFLEPEGEGDNYIDPAADIAAFLLQGGPREFPALNVDEAALDELFEIFAGKTLTRADFERMKEARAFPRSANQVKGDEIELVRRQGDPEQISEEEWQQRKLVYVGRKTISYYGCFGCHDIPEFETARPIGTALQDWGRKDTSRLAPEHIEEFLHHHSDVPEIARTATEREIFDGQASEDDLSIAFFYNSLLHHGRPGFIWQKLRQPRSYDYQKTETKGYDERLRMPKFPFDQEQVEAIVTFVLGLVADPPPEQYVFKPEGSKATRIEGERLLDKYNCAGCHMLDLPKITYGVNPDELLESVLGPGDFEDAYDLLMKLKPPRNALTGEQLPTGESVISFHGMLFAEPDYEDDPEYQEFSYDLWETLNVGDKQLFPGSKMLVPVSKVVEQQPARGGDFAQWLVPRLMEQDTDGNRFLAWQASPPPLYKEGIKVQTPWLYQFLKNPDRLRYTTVLRMPQFNMSSEEARSLANYFAAVDGVAYPYQDLSQQEPAYLAAAESSFHERFPDAESDYLETSWKLLNAPLCIKCHSVGGREYQSTDPKKDIRGPDLDRVEKRLRPDWTQLWLYKPAWITPYTSMPTVFPKGQQQFPELLGGDGQLQTTGVRDALMNYYRLLEDHGQVVFESQTEQPAQTGAGGAE